MTIDSDKILHDLLNSLDSLEGIRPGEIPNIALYICLLYTSPSPRD